MGHSWCVDSMQAQENGKTRVRGTVSGLAQGNHGFHVHQFGDYSPSEGCANAGGHFNPAGRQHGGPNDDERHAGDLGNIVADASGVAVIDFEDCQIPLSGENSIIGRSVVVGALSKKCQTFYFQSNPSLTLSPFCLCARALIVRLKLGLRAKRTP